MFAFQLDHPMSRKPSQRLIGRNTRGAAPASSSTVSTPPTKNGARLSRAPLLIIPKPTG
jgi:hypothetical protein